ncbi:hypothetical protein SAMN05660976_03234 [Nonomuraea pusilla]|uniref:DUF4386 family protein n=2 Tax=Nonomuraea pusilla TaxID=46177 RepID=A0A1H7SK45_9ACTN|nr:hypothetical protein SAMN05660976_03234 [Nonomuraea pusilla]
MVATGDREPPGSVPLDDAATRASESAGLVKGEAVMNERSWERIGAASGLAAAVLLLVALLMVPNPPGLDASAVAIVGYLGMRRAAVLTAALLMGLAVVAFLWFISHLRHVLQRAEGGAEAFSPVVLVSGVSLATMTALAMVPMTALATLATRPIGVGELGVARVLYAVHMLAVGPIGLLVALFAASAGAAMVRRELAGPWLGWAGMVVALIGLITGFAGFLAAPSAFTMVMTSIMGFAFLLWIGVASLAMLVRPEVEHKAAVRGVFAH